MSVYSRGTEVLESAFVSLRGHYDLPKCQALYHNRRNITAVESINPKPEKGPVKKKPYMFILTYVIVIVILVTLLSQMSTTTVAKHSVDQGVGFRKCGFWLLGVWGFRGVGS